MSKQIDLSMSKIQEFASELTSKAKNLANTATVFEDFVTPIANKSGSEKLVAVAQDISDVRSDFENHSRTAQNIEDGANEYTKQLKAINSI